MLDNILNTVRQGVEQVQRRGEELTQVARLKVEVFQLTRELDGHFARLGRAYHTGADRDLLSGIQDDIRRTEADIRNREALIAELGDEGEESVEGTSGTVTLDKDSGPLVVAPTPQSQVSYDTAPQTTQSPAAQPSPQQPAALLAPAASTPAASNSPSFVDETRPEEKEKK